MKVAGFGCAVAAAVVTATSAGAQESLMLDPILIESAARDAGPLLDTPVARDGHRG